MSDQHKRIAAAAREHVLKGTSLTDLAAAIPCSRSILSAVVLLMERAPAAFVDFEEGKITGYRARMIATKEGYKPKDQLAAERMATIKRMHAEGFSTDAIAREVGLHRQTLRSMMRANGMQIREDRIQAADARAAVESTADGLAAYVAGLEAIGPLTVFTPEEARDLARSIGRSLRALHSLKKQLLEIANEQQDDQGEVGGHDAAAGERDPQGAAGQDEDQHQDPA